jgi:UDP-N-acetylglucosamine 4-epimerase
MLDFKEFNKLSGANILITGDAGFLGSNLCEALLSLNAKVVCLDNFLTGHKNNVEPFLDHPNFVLIEGDIKNLDTCQKYCKNIDFVLHQAAIGSMPRSINDPITTHDVNVTGFLNMLIETRDNGVKRFIYAASSSTYGDSTELPKVEERIGKPLSPYAITKYVNELYADIFYKTYGLNTIGLRYFNVFGRRQDPNGAYAAVIPLFIKKLINHESPVINGDGTNSRDFTYIDNVVYMNLLSATTSNEDAIGQVFNTAVGDRTNLLQLTQLLKKYLSEFDEEITGVEILHGPNRMGDIPHSLASIEKASKLLDYMPTYPLEEGLKQTVVWYWSNL